MVGGGGMGELGVPGGIYQHVSSTERNVDMFFLQYV